MKLNLYSRKNKIKKNYYRKTEVNHLKRVFNLMINLNPYLHCSRRD